MRSNGISSLCATGMPGSSFLITCLLMRSNTTVYSCILPVPIFFFDSSTNSSNFLSGFIIYFTQKYLFLLCLLPIVQPRELDHDRRKIYLRISHERMVH